MSILPPPASTGPIVYPDSDGKPMAENTLQAQWIMTLKGNFDALFHGRPDVFVAMDHLWYPVEGEPTLRSAPDVYVVFGRPKEHRGSYKQWLEGDVPVTVAFEVLSPGNTVQEMTDKYLFYEEHGVEEYYVFDPDDNKLEVYLRKGDIFRRENRVDGFVSPCLGVRFEPSAGPEMIVYYPNGDPFLSFEDLAKRYEYERKRANDERKRADDERKRSSVLQQQFDALARYTELGRKARRGLATPEELAELERLDEEASRGAP